MNNKRERIRLGLVYRHPVTGYLGMVVWVGKHRHLMTGNLEPACDILWRDNPHGEPDRYFFDLVWAEFPVEGVFRKVSQVRRVNGTDVRYGLELDDKPGSHGESDQRLTYWLRHDEPERLTATTQIVRAWVARCADPARRI